MSIESINKTFTSTSSEKTKTDLFLIDLIDRVDCLQRAIADQKVLFIELINKVLNEKSKPKQYIEVGYRG